MLVIDASFLYPANMRIQLHLLIRFLVVFLTGAALSAAEIHRKSSTATGIPSSISASEPTSPGMARRFAVSSSIGRS